MFIDTNVLVATTNMRSPFHKVGSLALEAARAQPTVCYSTQIFREFYGTMTRPKAGNGLEYWSKYALEVAKAMFAPMTYLPETAQVRDKLIELVFSYEVLSRQIHDANIVATMLVHGERQLLTFNGGDFARYGDVIDIVTP
jgi:predicted nucleic acid-binding protein